MFWLVVRTARKIFRLNMEDKLYLGYCYGADLHFAE